MVPWANPSPNPKRHLDRFTCFCTAYGRASLYFTMGHPLLWKLLLPMAGSRPPSNTWFLEHTWAHNPNNISTGSAIFAQLTAECHTSPLKIAPSHWDIGPHLTHGSVDPLESSAQTSSKLVEPFLQGSLVYQTDRQTNWQTYRLRYSVGNNRPHLRT